MKRAKFLAFVAALMIAAACSEPLDDVAEVTPPQNEGAETPKKSHWGNKIEDPYSVSNMRLAFKELMKNSESSLSKAGVAEAQIVPTHLHLKFIPKTIDELHLLEADTILNVVPIPLTYDLEGFDGVYRDPECPAGQPTYQYAVARINYKLPNVEYEILDSLFMPFEDEYDPVAISKSAKFRSIWNDLELESVKLTGNFSEEDYNPPTLSKRYHPSGKVTYEDDVRGTVGVPNVRVHVNFSTHSHNYYTNEDGTFEVDGRFTWKVHFHVYFKCPEAAIYADGGTGDNDVAGSYGGKGTTCEDFGIDESLHKQNFAVIISAAYEYFHKQHSVSRSRNNFIKIVYYGNEKKYGHNYLKFTNQDAYGWGFKIYDMTVWHSRAFGTGIKGFAGIALESDTNLQVDEYESKVPNAWLEGVEWLVSKDVYNAAYCIPNNLVNDLMDTETSSYDYVSGYSIPTIYNCVKKSRTWNDFSNQLKMNAPSQADKNNLNKLLDYWRNIY